MTLIAGQKRCGASGVLEAAPHQHLCERLAHAQLVVQLRDGRRRAWWDLKAPALHGRPSVRAARDGKARRDGYWTCARAARSRRMPSRYTRAMPRIAPGTAYSTTATSVAFSPGIRSSDVLKAKIISPTTTEPTSEPTNAPTIPPQKRS